MALYIFRFSSTRFITPVLIFSSVAFSLFSILSVAMIMPVINYIFDYQSFLRTFGDLFPVRKPSPDVLLAMIAAAWLIFLLKNIFYYLSARATYSLEKSLTERFGGDLYHVMLNEPADQFYTGRHAERLNRLTTWLQRYSRATADGYASISRALPLLTGYFIILLSISWSLTALILIAIPFMTWTAHAFNKKIRLTADEERAGWDKLIHVLHQALSSVKLIRLFNSTGYETGRFQSSLGRFLRQSMRRIHLSGLSVTVLEMTGVTFGLLLLFMTGYGMWIGDFHFGPGGLVLFIASVFSMIDPAKWTVKSIQDLKEAASIRRQFVSSMKQTKPRLTNKRLHEFKSEIRWEEVNYRYPAADNYIFRNAGLIIRPKEKLLITGISGIGKSTFVDLTAGLLTPESGLITIDGIDVTEIQPGDISGIIGVLTQEPFLFNDTIRNNLNYPPSDRPDHVLRMALGRVQLENWLTALPGQLDTVIGERGATMSGGEKQRLTLARLLLRNPQIIFLDEATSGLDIVMENELMTMITDLFSDRTIVMISHRPSLSAFANRHIEIINQRFSVIHRQT